MTKDSAAALNADNLLTGTVGSGGSIRAKALVSKWYRQWMVMI